MKRLIALSLLLLVEVSTMAAGDSTTRITFDRAALGSVPNGWNPGVTGDGTPKWSVLAENGAAAKHQVLAQTGEGRYPICVYTAAALENGFVEVKFKPVAGKEDQAGGLIWRVKDNDNFYVARANALEDNVTIYHTVKGRRVAFKNTNLKVASGVWHTLRVDFQGAHFVVTFDGQQSIDASDSTFAGPGAVGVWTKADSVTYFDEFRFGSTKP